MKITHLEGGDKIGEKIALEAFKAMPSWCFQLIEKNPVGGTKAGL